MNTDKCLIAVMVLHTVPSIVRAIFTCNFEMTDRPTARQSWINSNKIVSQCTCMGMERKICMYTTNCFNQSPIYKYYKHWNGTRKIKLFFKTECYLQKKISLVSVKLILIGKTKVNWEVLIFCLLYNKEFVMNCDGYQTHGRVCRLNNAF